jgi:hypothetical protein
MPAPLQREQFLAMQLEQSQHYQTPKVENEHKHPKTRWLFWRP